jgi:hypothetical protein
LDPSFGVETTMIHYHFQYATGSSLQNILPLSVNYGRDSDLCLQLKTNPNRSAEHGDLRFRWQPDSRKSVGSGLCKPRSPPMPILDIFRQISFMSGDAYNIFVTEKKIVVILDPPQKSCQDL